MKGLLFLSDPGFISSVEELAPVFSFIVNEFDVVLISYPSSVPTLVPTADLTTSLPTKGPASSSNLRYHTLF